MKPEKYEFDAIIIGAGIVGLAVANTLGNQFENILVVEKESSFGKHVSSRNSEVIHSGIYYPPGSLKAELCITGNRLLYDFAMKNQINHKNCGKLVVVSEKKELDKLEAIMNKGIRNGVEGLQMLTRKEVKSREPLIKSAGALSVPSAGIVDSHGIMQKLEYMIKTSDSVIVYNLEAADITYANGNYTVSFSKLDYQAETKIVINAAGLWCTEVSDMLGINDYQLHICKGEYYKTSLYRNQIQSLIYPLPTEISLGLHIVLHLDGTIGFGPNAYYVDEIDYAMNATYKDTFLRHINTYLKLDKDDLTEDFTGIRPKIQAPGKPSRDFIIVNEKEKGFPNFINLIGIESPGLTCSLAIGEYVKNLINL